MSNNSKDKLNADNTKGDKKPTNSISQRYDDSGDDTSSDEIVVSDSDGDYVVVPDNSSADPDSRSDSRSSNPTAPTNTPPQNSNGGNTYTETTYNPSQDNENQQDDSSQDENRTENWEAVSLYNKSGENVSRMIYTIDEETEANFSSTVTINEISYDQSKLRVSYKVNSDFYTIDSFIPTIRSASRKIVSKSGNSAVYEFTLPSGSDPESAARSIEFSGCSLIDSEDSYGLYIKENSDYIPVKLLNPGNGKYVINNRLNLLSTYQSITGDSIFFEDSYDYSSRVETLPVLCNVLGIDEIDTNSNGNFRKSNDILYMNDGNGGRYLIWASPYISGTVKFEDNITHCHSYLLNNMDADKAELGKNTFLLNNLPDKFTEISVKLGSDDHGRPDNSGSNSESITLENRRELESLTIESDFGKEVSLNISGCDDLSEITIGRYVKIDRNSKIDNGEKTVLKVPTNSIAYSEIEDFAIGEGITMIPIN